MGEGKEQHGSLLTRAMLKAMALFSGSQGITILCSIVRTKLVAMWLGQAGVGLFAVLSNALEMLNTTTNLGIRQSSVRDIAQSRAGEGHFDAAVTASAVRRWSVWLGVGGALLTIALSPLLSLFSFKSTEWAWAFCAMAVAVLLMALTNGRQAVLQGTSQLRRLAAVTIAGAVGGLVVSVPMFYFWRMDSVVPSIIAYAAAVAAAAWMWRDRTLPAVKLAAAKAWQVGRQFIIMGAYMTGGAVATTVAGYVLVSWLNGAAGLDATGIYQSANIIVNKYAGVVLTALGMEFYPRLAGVAHSRLRTRVHVSQELNVAVTVIVPVAMLLVMLRGLVVSLLYTSEFGDALPVILWAAPGIVARTVSWIIAFVMLARADGRMYIVTETLSALLSVVLAIAGYRLAGLPGLGMAYTAWYVAYAVIVAVVYRLRYRLSVSRWALASVAGGAVLIAAIVATEAASLNSLSWVLTAVTSGAALTRLRRLWQSK